MNASIYLILGLVLMAILYGVSAYIYRRKGIQGKKWIQLIGAYILGLVVIGLMYFFIGMGVLGSILLPVVVGGTAVLGAMRWRPRTANAEISNR